MGDRFKAVMSTDEVRCQAVENELKKLHSRLGSVEELSESTLQKAINDLEAIKREISNRSSDELESPPSNLQQAVIKELLVTTKHICKNVSGQHKDMHPLVSKFGKSIDKNFMSDYSSVARDFDEDDKIAMLNEVVCEHFLRQGKLDIAETLIEEGGLELKEEMKLPFLEMHAVVQALKEKDVTPALRWCERNQSALESIHSTLEFDLHRMNVLLILCTQSISARMSALNYVKKNLQQYVSSHSQEIQQLMGCFLFCERGLELSPYAHLISINAWERVIEQFSRDACILLGLPVESPLTISINAGTKALAPLLHITGVMLQKHVNPVWGAKDELPVEIDLGHDTRFHSIFACPILRQHTSENNPPMRLVCGHVISKEALHKLSNGHKLKCPYCPVEQTPQEAVQLYL